MNIEPDKISFILATNCGSTTGKARFFRAYAHDAYAKEVSILGS